MGGNQAGRQGWPPGRRAGKGVSLGGTKGGRPAGGRAAEVIFISLYEYICISLYVYMIICVYLYMNIF